MYCVIVGCGMVGSRVAAMLSRNGHNVSIIDKNPESFVRLPPEFDGMSIVGTGFDEEILKSAGIERADVFSALTDNDNVNIMASAVAKTIFKVKRVITRVFNPEREKTFKMLGLEIVSPTVLGAEQVYSRFIMGENSAHLYLGENNLELLEHVYEPIDLDETVADIEIDNEIRVVAIVRNNQSMIPKDSDLLKKGDRVITAVSVSSIHKSQKIFGFKTSQREKL
jgi:trk system potassium uptake protein TrkA